MAKVDTIKLNIDGKEYSYNVNVGVSGIFKCHLDWEIAKKLGINPIIVESTTLSELQATIMKPYIAYLKATKIESIWIWIEYKASYPYDQDSKGMAMFNNFSQFAQRGFSSDVSGLGFEFGVNIKVVNSTGTETWYSARKGQGTSAYGEADFNDESTWYKYSTTHTTHKIVIPYSDQAYKTLETAREGLRTISEILFNFLSQDPALIESALLGGNLLPIGKTEINK